MQCTVNIRPEIAVQSQSVSLSHLGCGHGLPLEHWDCKITMLGLRLTFDIDIYYGKDTSHQAPRLMFYKESGVAWSLRYSLFYCGGWLADC